MNPLLRGIFYAAIADALLAALVLICIHVAVALH